MFADDTGIFQPKDIFLELLGNDTREDGSDTGRILMELFDVLDTPEGDRQTGLSGELNAFPYVNGALFAGRLRTPVFDAKMRTLLIDACRHDWTGVSPAIFGSLFQSVMDAKERRAKGAHYTSESNIMKVIGPLFLDDLRAELDRLIARRTGREGALLEYQAKLSRLTFLDPACGCGNFLVIAYREIRRLELDCLKALYPTQAIDAVLLSRVTVEQFYGIEIEEFPARIAEIAMWMTDHLANNEYNEAFKGNTARIPLRHSAHIRHADALDTDWSSVVAPEQLRYIMGNPPFVGAKFQTLEQRAEVRAIAGLGGSGGTLDFVAAWFIKAGQMVSANPRIRIAFVSTNSVSQGEQVAQLWPILFDRFGLEIAFAHRTFAWGSEARGAAHVHVVVIGLAHRDNEPAEKRLFSYPDIRREPIESQHGALTAYLFDARGVTNRHLVVKEESRPINGAGRIVIGSKPIDGGYLIFDANERRDLLQSEPDAAEFIRPYVSGEDFINGGGRWIAALQSASPERLRNMPKLMDRIARVRRYRSGEIPAKGKSKDKMKEPGTSSRSLASTPTAFHVTVLPKRPYLAIPEVSSERREYVPIGWLAPPTIPSAKIRLLDGATLWDFGLLTSRSHVAWTAHIGGRLKSDFQYGIGLNYNTFPWPDATPAQRARVEQLAQAVLDARAAHPTASLADLYDPDTMPGDLRRAHHALDLAVDKLYRPAPFASDRDRVEHLFGRYEALVNPLATSGVKANRRVARRDDRKPKPDCPKM
ncbi:class I SAM-dependent DNA methyltransferase [Sphingomonas sp.]|uniref:class I SAM-dependent DNA methyltransferase n=1 Tax=Sphingomonas sp. TaxID=28214 RepID=UPI003CC5BF37